MWLLLLLLLCAGGFFVAQVYVQQKRRLMPPVVDEAGLHIVRGDELNAPPPLNGTPDGQAAQHLLVDTPTDQSTYEMDAVIAKLKARDPGFTAEALCAGAAKALIAVFRGWTHLQPDQERRHLADGLWNAYCTQIEDWRARGMRNVVDDLSVRSAHFAALADTPTATTARIRITVSSTDYDVDRSRQIVRGDETPRHWVQDWILQRDAAAVTRDGGGILEEHCPACGAALQLDENGRCPFCRTVVIDGKADWVVVAFSGVAEEVALQGNIFGSIAGASYRPSAIVFRPTIVPLAVDKIRAHDPSFSADALIAGARHVLLELVAAWASGNLLPLRAALGDDAYAVAEQAATTTRRPFANVTFGAAFLRSATMLDDVASVTVRVGFAAGESSESAATPIAGSQPQPVDHFIDMTFVRDATAPGAALVCPTCGAPLPTVVASACPACGAALAAEAWGWKVTALGAVIDGTAEVPRSGPA